MPRPRSSDRDAEISELVSPDIIKNWMDLWVWCMTGGMPEGNPAGWHDHPDPKVRDFADLKVRYFSGHRIEQNEMLRRHMSDRTRQRLLARLRQRARTVRKEHLQLQRVDLPRKLVDDYDHLAGRSGEDRAGAMQMTLDLYRESSRLRKMLETAASLGRGRGPDGRDMSGEEIIDVALRRMKGEASR